VNDAVQRIRLPGHVTKELKDILSTPAAFHIHRYTPSHSKFFDDNARRQKCLDEFTLTFRYFPGQTLYHDALFISKKPMGIYLF